MTPAARRVLMLCYHYPPMANGGVPRSVSFARRLPALGWEPVVFTTGRFGGGPGAAGERVVRVSEPHGAVLSRAAAGDADAGGEGAGAAGGGVIDRARRALLRFADRRLMIPDNKIRWALRARGEARRIVRQERIDLVYSTSPPHSTHLLALRLARRSALPWVMDLRDPWTIEPIIDAAGSDPLRRRIEEGMEAACVGAAAAVVLNTPEAAARYRERYPAAAGRIHCVTNGWDADEMAAADALSGRSAEAIGGARFVAAHIGTFERRAGRNRPPAALLDALVVLVSRGELVPGRDRVLFVGEAGGEAPALLEEAGLTSLVLLTGPLPRRDALAIARRADLLLLVETARDSRFYVRGKLYEYIGAGGWILGLVSPGATRDLLEASGRGGAVDPGDTEAIAAAIRRIHREPARPPTRRGFDAGRYERGRLAAELARILDEAAKGR
ncbi:MAG: glycosyltransferase [Candidatus Krumholzibacteriota bacterium]|nr:glycosyltransferase [Candidatus Krumholzibacteriota bacterium]